MEYAAEELPDSCFVECKGSFQTRNARFRRAVCQHFRLQVVNVNGSGNCFFESVIMLLRAADLCPDTLTALELRRSVVQFFRTCIDSQEEVCERVQMEIEVELQEELVCSSRAKVNGVKVHGLVPETIQVYLDAVEQDNVWVQGWHWQRAISLLFNVRVAVVIFGQPVVRFIGQGPVTIYLYKIDAETHFDPMLPLAPDQALQCTLPTAPAVIEITSDSSPPPATASGGVHSTCFCDDCGLYVTSMCTHAVCSGLCSLTFRFGATSNKDLFAHSICSNREEIC
jgi:hypothetical protein